MSDFFGGQQGTSGGGAPTDATYLTLTANGDLSAEVIVREPFFGRIQRDSTTAISLQRYAGQLCVVNGEAIDPGSGGISLAVTDNLISSTGTDSGANMAPSTLYYIYLSNSQASFADSELRGSTTAPSLVNGVKYLGTSGNALHWRFVGWLRTNATGGDGEIEDNTTNRLLINYYNRRPLAITLKPGYSDNNSGTSYTYANTSYGPCNGGTGDTGSYIANGEDSVFIVSQVSAALDQVDHWRSGIGDNSTTTAVIAALRYTQATPNRDHIETSYSSTPAEGYRTVCILVAADSGTLTCFADSSRAGSAADPIGTSLNAIVWG